MKCGNEARETGEMADEPRLPCCGAVLSKRGRGACAALGGGASSMGEEDLGRTGSPEWWEQGKLVGVVQTGDPVGCALCPQ